MRTGAKVLAKVAVFDRSPSQFGSTRAVQLNANRSLSIRFFVLLKRENPSLMTVLAI
jgi:hypothetical protein